MIVNARHLQAINHYVGLASGVLAIAGLFYFRTFSTWWWACIFDLVLFTYKMAAKLDLAMIDRPKSTLLPRTTGAWHRWFAWYPVQVDIGAPSAGFRLPGDWAFLCSVERRWAADESGLATETHYAYLPAP